MAAGRARSEEAHPLASLDQYMDHIQHMVGVAGIDHVGIGSDLLGLLADRGVPSGRVYTALDALADPHYLARGMVQHLTSVGGTTMPVTGVVPGVPTLL